MKPNIIFYFSDQQRWDTLNSSLMPNVWELGEEGVLFEILLPASLSAALLAPVCRQVSLQLKTVAIGMVLL